MLVAGQSSNEPELERYADHQGLQRQRFHFLGQLAELVDGTVEFRCGEHPESDRRVCVNQRLDYRQCRMVERVQALVTVNRAKLFRLAALTFVSVASLACVTSCTAPEPPAVRDGAGAPDLDNWAANMERCLEAGGWEMEITPDGGIHTTVPQGQESSYDDDYRTCEESLGYDESPVYTDDQVRGIYKKVVATAECLTDKGYSPGSPPSEQTFVEQVQSGPGGWDPYSDLYPATMDTDEYYVALEECPRTWH